MPSDVAFVRCCCRRNFQVLPDTPFEGVFFLGCDACDRLARRVAASQGGIGVRWPRLRRNIARPVQLPDMQIRNLLVSVLVVGGLVAVIIPSCSYQRRRARESSCESSLHMVGITTYNFASDFSDRMTGLDARAGSRIIEYDGLYEPQCADLGIAATDLQAVAHQTTQIIRHRRDEQFIPASDWLACPNYWWIPHGDYIDDMFPSSLWVCPEDKQRLELRYPPNGPRVPAGYKGEGMRVPQVPQGPDPAMQRWGYSSSYQLVPTAWSRDERANGLSTVAQGATNSDYLVPKGESFGPPRKLSEVRFPSSKVLVMDTIDRHHGDGTRFYADPDARQPLLFADASVRVVRTRDTDAGFQPNNPSGGRATRFRYSPAGYELSWTPASRDPAREYDGHYRWTRGGLRGMDVLPSLPASSSPDRTLDMPDTTDFDAAVH